MHSIWYIPELLEAICDFLGISDVAAMASVCRTFWWTAMPYVWRNINTFYKLMQLLPEDALSTIHDIARRLNDSDWARFLTHSKYTKKLCVIIADETSEDYLQLLPHLPSTPLLPNLESAELEISRISESPNLGFMSLFLARTLSEKIKLPPLKSFSIRGSTSSADQMEERLSQLLRSQQGLQAVNIDFGSGSQILEILHSTGQLLHLRHLSLRTIYSYCQFEQAPRLLFQELETLKLEGPPFFIHAVLDCVGSGNMRSVKLLVNNRRFGEGNAAEYGILLTSCLVSIGRFVRLKTLDLQSGIPVSTNLLDHVLTCENLENLRLVGAYLDPLETEESRHRRMAMAWPRLTTLELQRPTTFEESSSAAS
ncbi:hypothetical protein M407DRAFT_233851 [Tulasnella calospora MUT 4182]|uniref:F-box domain-containing protein n=1 Tax=Tulasnella calospora MUT 4182 TaxID=1051891 RepID=A0A0C3Q9Y0_9AGAM|nr:hypothetical protein M407DRAFT_233851 [Tulasnella calospora MUT 4182]